MILRSVFFVPGDSEKKLAKSLQIPADLLVYDLEDSVLPQRRAAAREMVVGALGESLDTGRRRAVRINALDTDDARKDLAAVVRGKPNVIMLPKIFSVEDINTLDACLAVLEARESLSVGEIKILPVATETAKVMFELGNLGGSPRCVGLTWGAEDLSAALGASTNKDDEGEWLFTYQMARSQCLLAARAADVEPIDTVYTDFRNETGLRESCRTARRDGFTGKLAIHPNQVEVINESFSPSEAELAMAREVIAAFDANPDAGAIQIDGKMLDIPHLKQARNLLQRHADLTE